MNFLHDETPHIVFGIFILITPVSAVEHLHYATPQISKRLLRYLPAGRRGNLARQARNQAEAGDM